MLQGSASVGSRQPTALGLASSTGAETTAAGPAQREAPGCQPCKTADPTGPARWCPDLWPRVTEKGEEAGQLPRPGLAHGGLAPNDRGARRPALSSTLILG